MGSKKSKRKAAKLIAASQARRATINELDEHRTDGRDARTFGHIRHGEGTRIIEWGDVQGLRSEDEIILGDGTFDNPWYFGTVIQFEPVEATDEQLADGEDETPPRWEIESRVGGEWIVRDNLTGFIAYEDDHDGVVSLHYELAVDGVDLQTIAWREEQSDSEVLVSSADETYRFHFLLHNGEHGAFYDRDTKLVMPIAEDIHIETAFATLNELNDDWAMVAVWRWMPVHEWLIPPPEDIEERPEEDTVLPELPESEDAEAPASHETPDLPPVRVLVVSSRRWAWQGIVAELIQTYWNGLDNPPLVLLTSGSPYGAEAIASRLAGTVPGVTHEFIRDEDIPRSNIDYAFAFMTNKSAGAERVLKLVKRANIPVHILRETSAIINDPWLDR